MKYFVTLLHMKLLKPHVLTILLSVVSILIVSGISSIYFKDAISNAAQRLQNVFISEKKQEITLTDPNMKEHVVTLTENGFEPNELVIRQSDEVIFKTTRGVPFWPASNNHPEHTIYTEFDSLGRVAPDAQWLFKFKRLGTFKYHDHISANDTGTIVVLPGNTKAKGEVKKYAKTTNLDECTKYQSQSEKQQCWDQQLELVLNESGIDVAFDYFIKLYETDPGSPKECHGWGHTLGKAGYELYKEGIKLSLRPEAAYCGYGYFHGFIGELMRDTGDMNKTKDFCEYVVDELQDELTGIKDNCVHGVGHGTTAMLIEQPDYWGNFQKTVDKGVKVCETIYKEQNDLTNCYDGIFNEISLNLFQSTYGLSFDEYKTLSNNDIFYYCQQQKERHKESCYFEFTGIFWTFFEGDPVKSMQYALENTQDLEKRGNKVVAKIAADQIQYDIVKDDHSRSIEACSIVPDFLKYECFKGILNGFVQHGDPLNLHIKGYAFCDEFGPAENKIFDCYETLTDMLQWTYKTEQIVEACRYATKIRNVQNCDKYLTSV